MPKEKPDHNDADLILRIYDMRRESVLRESRTAINRDYWPRSAAEAAAVLQPDHPLNQAWRQTTGYWEMVYSMARYGVVHADFLADNNGEGLFLFARVEPYLTQLRAASSPRLFRNTEWIATECEMGKSLASAFRARVAQRMASG